MTSSPGENANATRSRLEAQANALRAKLVRELEALRRRKNVLLDPVEEMRRHPTGTAVMAGAAALVLGTVASVAGYRVVTRRERARRLRIEGWRRLFARPEEAAPPRRSFAVTALERTALAGITAVTATVAQHYAREILATLLRAAGAPEVQTEPNEADARRPHSDQDQ